MIKNRIKKLLLPTALLTMPFISLLSVSYKKNTQIEKKVQNDTILKHSNKENKNITFDDGMKLIGKSIEDFVLETKVDLAKHSKEELAKMYFEFVQQKLKVARAYENKFEYYWYWLSYWRWYVTYDRFWKDLGMKAIPGAIISSMPPIELAGLIIGGLTTKFVVSLTIPLIGKLLAGIGMTFAVSVAGAVIGHKFWEEPTASRGIVMAFFGSVYSGSWKQ